MLIGVDDIDCLAAHGHGAGDPQSGVKTHDFPFLGNCRPELAIVAVEQKDADPIRLQQFLGFARD